jgi:hypothetical protein
MFGRRPRTKAPEQIGRELDLLRTRSVHRVFFVDDNLIGNKKEARGLLRYLADYQERHNYRFVFSTEVSLNLAEDEELLGLFRAANFASVFIGIESPDAASLQETGKTQNLRSDMLGAVHTIYAHGIDVLAGFIVGFDNDTPHTFDRQYRFIMDSGVQVAMVGLLTALPHTPLYERLEREGRLLPHEGVLGDNTKPVTNVLPKRMAYAEMIQRYEALFRRLFRPDGAPAGAAAGLLCGAAQSAHRGASRGSTGSGPRPPAAAGALWGAGLHLDPWAVAAPSSRGLIHLPRHPGRDRGLAVSPALGPRPVVNPLVQGDDLVLEGLGPLRLRNIPADKDAYADRKKHSPHEILRGRG